ncbi:MAG: hypothetical protein IJ632_00815 [Muribaculaceae bacterium]|nr:hypothetical protein [Muribaculaceae bacterium]
MERSDIARIGFFGRAKEYEVYIKTDDECQTPHFHVSDIYTETDTAICLLSNDYCKHSNGENHTFKYDFGELLFAFMKEPCRSPRYADNYELAVTMWNLNNQSECSCQNDEDGCSIIPDYRSMNTRIVIIKSIQDNYDCDHLQSDEDINPLSYALTKKFLNKNGVLFQRLMNQFHLVPNIRIVLKAEQNEAKEVVSLHLYIDRKDLWMAQEISNYDGMMTIMEAYFKEQGLNTIHPSTQEDMSTFLAWMRNKLPVIDEYITIKTDRKQNEKDNKNEKMCV